MRLLLAAGLLAGCQTTGPVAATTQPATAVSGPVQPSQSFPDWLASLRRDALAQGVRGAVFDRAFQNVRLSDRVIQLDSSQPEFARQPWTYLDTAVSETRVRQGRAKLAANGPLLTKVARDSGVPAEILVAFWGIETDYGHSVDGFKVIDAVTTLAYRSRRAAYFREELLAALKILDAGDIAQERMTGSWAGAMGQTQFMPTIFLKYAVDADGDGRRDIWNSLPDVFASTARFVNGNGWRTGESWGEEVRLPQNFPWEEAELTVTKPVAEWRRLGVRAINGGELAGTDPASILLLAGHTGPAFLVRANFQAIMRYNPSTSYALAVALLADRMAGGGGIVAAWPRQEQAFTKDERLELQQRLAAIGFDPGTVDGIVGANTRNAVRRFQKTVGALPDGFATKELLVRLRQAGGGASVNGG